MNSRLLHACAVIQCLHCATLSRRWGESQTTTNISTIDGRFFLICFSIFHIYLTVKFLLELEHCVVRGDTMAILEVLKRLIKALTSDVSSVRVWWRTEVATYNDPLQYLHPSMLLLQYLSLYFFDKWINYELHN